MKLTQAEKKWFERLQKALDSAPKSLTKKGILSYTIGDPFICVFDNNKLEEWKEKQKFMRGYDGDVSTMVHDSDSELCILKLPFPVESTAG